MNRRKTTALAGALVGLLAMGSLAIAQDTEPRIPDEAECTVCARLGVGHGAESVAAWREYQDEVYTFCSKKCAESFDKMPEGYATPTLPRPAPSVALRTLEGEAFELVQEGTEATLVDFWATWCVPCLEMMPKLSRLYDERAAQGFRVVGISIDEDRTKLDRFLRKNAPSYPVVHDGGDDPAWWAFRVPAVPATFLVDAQGAIVAQWGADFSEDALLEALARLDSSEGADGSNGR